MNVSFHFPGINAQECNCGSYDNYLQYFFKTRIDFCVCGRENRGHLHVCGVFALAVFKDFNTCRLS